MGRVTPFPPCHFFEVHGSKFKLHPFCYLGQASVLCITHRVFFFCICKDSFNRFFAALIKRLVLGYISGVVRQILIVLPDMTSYVLWMQESGKSPSTIKTDLAAIRFFHDKMSNPKYRLPTNDELAVELERRCFGGTDRTWSNTEFNKMLGKALAVDRYDFILALYLARYAGLRIHECFRIDTATAERALRENAITIKGKGGKVRTVSINEQIAIAMRKQLERTPRGHKLLVPDDMLTDRAINHLQFFIMKHRDEVRDTDSDRPMTFHGLRHTYAAEKYQELINNGKSPLDAHFEVSRLLGHERPDVTNIYLASVRKGDKHEQ